MRYVKELNINGKTYAAHCFTGQVLDEKKWLETEISGGGGGGTSYQGSGSTYVAPIKTTNTTHDQIILGDEEGAEEAFRFADMEIACRKGNTLSVVWGVPEGKQEGPFWFVYNHNTGDTYPTGAFEKLFATPLWLQAAGAVVVGYLFMFVPLPAIFYLAGPVAGVFGARYLYYGPMGKDRVSDYRNSGEYKEFNTQIASSAEQLKQLEAP